MFILLAYFAINMLKVTELKVRNKKMLECVKTFPGLLGASNDFST